VGQLKVALFSVLPRLPSHTLWVVRGLHYTIGSAQKFTLGISVNS